MTYTTNQVPTAAELNNLTPSTITFEGTTVAPSTAEGKIYYNTTTNHAYFYDGTGWVPLGILAGNFYFNSNLYTQISPDITVTVSNSSGTSSSESVTTGLPSNCHITAKLDSSLIGTSANNNQSGFAIGNATDGWTLYHVNSNNDNAFNISASVISIVALGSNTYDIYYSLDKVGSAISKPNGPQIKVIVDKYVSIQNHGGGTITASDIRYATWSVN